MYWGSFRFLFNGSQPSLRYDDTMDAVTRPTFSPKLRAALSRWTLLKAGSERLRAGHLGSSFPAILHQSGRWDLQTLAGQGFCITIP